MALAKEICKEVFEHPKQTLPSGTFYYLNTANKCLVLGLNPDGALSHEQRGFCGDGSMLEHLPDGKLAFTCLQSNFDPDLAAAAAPAGVKLEAGVFSVTEEPDRLVLDRQGGRWTLYRHLAICTRAGEEQAAAAEALKKAIAADGGIVVAAKSPRPQSRKSDQPPLNDREKEAAASPARVTACCDCLRKADLLPREGSCEDELPKTSLPILHDTIQSHCKAPREGFSGVR
jgi:hypothetical protein